jgi:hypothetical protein
MLLRLVWARSCHNGSYMYLKLMHAERTRSAGTRGPPKNNVLMTALGFQLGLGSTLPLGRHDDLRTAQF